MGGGGQRRGTVMARDRQANHRLRTKNFCAALEKGPVEKVAVVGDHHVWLDLLEVVLWQRGEGVSSGGVEDVGLRSGDQDAWFTHLNVVEKASDQGLLVGLVKDVKGALKVGLWRVLKVVNVLATGKSGGSTGMGG